MESATVKTGRHRQARSQSSETITDEICMFCQKDDVQIETHLDDWIQCDTCKKWSHLFCLMKKTQQVGSVPEQLWDYLEQFEFKCPECDEFCSIPAQLQRQEILSRETLQEMGVPDKYLLEAMETEQKYLETNTPPLPTQSGARPKIHSQTTFTLDSKQQNTSSNPPNPPIPSTNSNGDFMAFLTYLREKDERDRQKEERDRLERQVKEEREQEERRLDRLERERDREERRIERESRERKEQAEREERRAEREKRQQQIPSTSHSNWNPTEQNTKSVKLPELAMPKFDGTLLRWHEFWDVFKSTVHDRNDMSSVQKFAYLKRSLTGTASLAIQSYPLTEENYGSAVDTLIKRFDNKGAIRDNLLSQLQSLPVSSMKGFDLRQTFDHICSICTQLERTGLDPANELLLPLIQKKFPYSMNIQLADKKQPNTSWTLPLYKAALEAQIQNIEAVWLLQNSSSTSTHKPDVRIREPSQNPTWNTKPSPSPCPFPVRGTATGLSAGNTQVSSNQRPTNGSRLPRLPNGSKWPCIFCKDINHRSSFCSQLKSLEERQKFIQMANRCPLCFSNQHQNNCPAYPKFKPCGCGSNLKHNTALCPTWLDKRSKIGQQESSNTAVQGTSELGNVASLDPLPNTDGYLSYHMCTFLQFACAEVMGTNGDVTHQARIFLDNGSSTTWMLKDFAVHKLGLKFDPSNEKSIVVSSFNAQTPHTISYFDADIMITTRDGKHIPCSVTVIDHLTAPLKRSSLSERDQQFIKNKADLKVAEGTIPTKDETLTVDILIGQDYIWDFLMTDCKEPQYVLPSGLKLLPSVFGYIVAGRYQSDDTKKIHHASEIAVTYLNQVITEVTQFTKLPESVEPIPDLKDFWELELIGIKDSPTVSDDDRALQRFNDTIKFENHRYQVTLAWKADDVKLPDNKSLALGRFNSLTKRLCNDKDLLEKYDVIIQEQLNKGIIEKVQEAQRDGPRVHYLPHHPVITPQKTTTKVRIVYNASARESKNSLSLNECLYRGPVILPDLGAMLLRFRTTPIAMLADVEKAFLQVGLQESERDVTRFYWYQNPKTPIMENNLQIYRFCRVAFGIICSPFLLEATIKYHLQQIGTPVAMKIMENIYVDNVLIGGSTVEECQRIYHEAKQIFNEASMNLREWNSNSQEFQEAIPEIDRVLTNKTKVLGLSWYRDRDCIQIPGLETHPIPEFITKRQILHMVACIFDPLGYFSPVTFYGKLFLQTLWDAKKSWDEELEETLVNDWRQIEHKLRAISTHYIPRYLGSPVQTTSTNTQLLIFCDASQKAYSAVAYLRFPNSETTYDVQLLFSKVRLASRTKNVKTGNSEHISLPRLELLAVLIGVRMSKFVGRELQIPISERILWTDSQCVLMWIKSSKPLPIFVENRLKEIRNTDNLKFRYVPSEDNPADWMTRGKTVTELSDFWWKGPQWLQTAFSTWPAYELPENTPDNETHDFSLVSSREDPLWKNAEEFLDVLKIERFSSFRKLLGTVCYIRRFCQKKIDRKEGPLTPDELQEAEKILATMVQHKHLTSVFTDMKTGNKNNLQLQLGLQIDSQGLLRCHGRVDLANLPFDAKFPILLPGTDEFTKLLVKYVHERLFHYGTNHTLSQIRLKYWIPKGRRIVFQIIKKCPICKIFTAKPGKLPPIPILPKERVQQARPFQYVGVDYLGPVYIKEIGAEHPSKAWICLFTCLTIRAVHLELANDMSASQFLNCLRRFVSRRGTPQKIISDNALNFKLVHSTLHELYHHPSVAEYVSREKIKWIFITEMAPWQGGFYERMIGIVKTALKKSLGRRFYAYEELTTILTEIESVVNSRPLTFVWSDNIDTSPITPSHFLTFNGQRGLPSMESDPEDPEYIPQIDSRQKLLKTLEQRWKPVEIFWKNWMEQYLISLRERFQREHKGSKGQIIWEPTIGEVVLIKEEKLPRSEWLMGIVQEIIHRQDGQILSVKLRTSRGTEINRPLNLLYPLEIYSSSQQKPELGPENKSTKDSGTGQNAGEKNTRPTRRAKEQAKMKISEQLKEDVWSTWLVPKLSVFLGVLR